MDKHTYSIRYGIIAGVGVILYLLLFYVIDVKTMLGPMVYWSGTVLYFGAMFLAVRDHRKNRNEGFITFREALPVAFLTYLIANLFFYAYLYVMFNFVDPSLPELQKEVSLALVEDFKGNESLAETIEQIKDIKAEFTLSQAFFGYIQGAILAFLLSLVVAGVSRNK